MLMSKSIWKAKKKYMFLWWIEKVVCRPPGPGHGTVEEYDPVLSGWEITVGWGSFSIMTFINHENHFHSFASDRGGDPSFGRVVARSCKKRGPRYFACHQPKSRGKKGESSLSFIGTTFNSHVFCLMSDCLMYSPPYSTRHNLLILTRGTKAWKLFCKVFSESENGQKKVVFRNVRKI